MATAAARADTTALKQRSGRADENALKQRSGRADENALKQRSGRADENALKQRSGRADNDSWWGRAHPAAAAEEAELRREVAKIAAWRKHESHGTPETLIKASRVRQGALARLFMAGHISIDQLAWSAEIRAVIERIGRDVTVRSISLETRVDNGFAGNRLEEESLGRVREEVAYSRWRAGLVQEGAKQVGLVLAIIAENRAVRSAARAFGMRDGRARAILICALDRWPDCCGWARDRVDEDDLVAAHLRLSARPMVSQSA